MDIKKVGLALGAGGARGIAHVGVLEALLENNIPIDFIVGSSMGGIVGGLFASGFTIEQLKEQIKKLRILRILDFDINLLKSLGILRGEKVKRILTSIMEKDMDISETKIPFACTVVDILSGKQELLTKGSLITGMRATSAIPGVFRPVEVDGMLCVDGGILNRVPVDEVKNMGADVVIAVDVLGPLNEEDKPKSFVEMIARFMLVMDDKITSAKDISNADFFLVPEQNEVVSYSVKNLDKSYEAGRKIVLDNLDKIKQSVFGE